jgi:uncharacterized membrane protein
MGYLLSPLLFFCGSALLYPFLFFVVFMGIDGLTQLLCWRISNNFLRLFSGLGFGITFLPFVIYIIGGVANAY